MSKRTLCRGFLALAFGLFISGAELAPAFARSAAWLEPVIGTGYGVQVKEWSVTDGDLRMMKAAGLRHVRFVIPWAAVEEKKGEYSWRTFAPFMRKLRAHGIHAVIVLGGGHPDYTGEIAAPEGNLDHSKTYLLAPATPEARAAFVLYAAETVKQFDGDDVIWELWNEPDHDHFWPPKANVNDYTLWANETCWAMRKVAPSARIIGPGMAETAGQWGTMLPGFLGKVLQAPVADCLDALSMHPYRDGAKPPETVGKAYQKLRDFVKVYTQDGRAPLPIVSSEWGFSLIGNTPEEQAAFLLRSFLLNTLHAIPLSIWYEWRDSRRETDNPEAHYGLLTIDRKFKPSYKALRDFLPPLVGARIEQRLAVGGKQDYILHIKHEKGEQHLVYWTADPSSDTRLIYKCGQEGKQKQVVLTAMPERADCGAADPQIVATHYKAGP